VLAEYHLPDGQAHSPLHTLVGLFQTAEQDEARRVLRDCGTPHLAGR